MKNWIRDIMKTDYMRRQVDLMSSVGLFYIIIVALFAVPLLATFVVVLIKGVLDFRYLILGGGIVVSGLALYLAGRFFYRLYKRVKADGASAIRLAKDRAERGESVQLQLLGGLFSLSYGANGNGRDAIAYAENGPLLLEGSTGIADDGATADPIGKLRELSELKEQGIIDDEEFRKLKEKLIKDVCDG